MCDIKDGWICVAKRNQVSPDTPLTVERGERGVGIYELDGRIYAMEDVCPHAYALLSQGFIQDGTVECPLHAAIFDIKTGQCVDGPGGRDLETYPVQIEGENLYIQIKTQ